MRPLIVTLFALAVLSRLFAAGPAAAEERLALVVGNGGYTAVTSLDNPANDARLIGATLEDLGFDVTLLIDADLATLNRGVAGFGAALRAAGSDATGLFYFAGHGIQSFGANYLLPVDAAVTDAAELDFVALEAQTVLRQMFSARNRTNIVILDACRNNPFTRIPEFGDNGLAEMKAPTGTFLAYATAPGNVAMDGAGANSPFSEALAREMRVPGRTIEEVFRNVRVSVIEATRGAQTPWDTSSITAAFVFAPEAPADPDRLAAEAMWASVRATDDPLQVMLYLRGYPDSPFAGEARALLNALMSAEQSSPAAPAPAPQVREPSARESALIGRAQSSGLLEDYQAYLDEFPDGVFAELAALEIATLERRDPDQGTSQSAALAAPPAGAGAATPEPLGPGRVTFDAPLVGVAPEIDGRSIAELIEGSPLFPPIEGLPEELWKDQHCSNCHQWTREALCTQSQVYLGALAERSLGKAHPYGGGLKNAMRSWAADDCP